MKEKIQPFLMVLLVGAAFAIGSMWTQLRMMKDGKSDQIKQTEEQGQVAGEEEEEILELSDEQWQKLLNSPAAVKGEEGAKVIMAELTDYQCPFCKRYVDETLVQIDRDYIQTGKVKYLFLDLPLGFHQSAQLTAEAARCAGDQEKYWEMHDLLFDKQAEWSAGEAEGLIKKYAISLGLNSDDFNSCLETGKYTQAVKDNLSLAEEVKANGTPSFFINGQKIVGAQPYATFKAMIDQALGE